MNKGHEKRAYNGKANHALDDSSRNSPHHIYNPRQVEMLPSTTLSVHHILRQGH
jgi:hypothetical protein